MIYLDTSAAVKALVAEQGSAEVVGLFAQRDDLVSSRLLEVELHAVASRRGLREVDARSIVDRVALVSLDDDIARRAVHLGSGLRALDALHLATVLALGPAVEGLVCFDRELTDAAAIRGIRVVTLPLGVGPASA